MMNQWNIKKLDSNEQQHPCLLRFFFFLQSLQVLATAILLSSSSAIILSSSSSARTEGRRNHYKVAADAEEGRRRRRSVAKASQLNNSSPLLLTTSIESPSDDDPKAGLRNRYKDLCGRYTELTTKGATNEETYKIAVNAWNKAMEAIDACIRGGEKEKNTNDTSPIGIEKALCIESTNNKVKGIKTKGKIRGSSRRPKNFLEKRRRKKTCLQDDGPSVQKLAYGLPPFESFELPTYIAYNNTCKETGSNISMTELLQVI
ncbi:unnamed protein product [Lupinus luteus]|uniref:Pectinesterase inhibitor domain-containing protein n=1 Tax=Lupinus luteus TaxID=3873 RepID=A0AAV1X2Y3_LUPLU